LRIRRGGTAIAILALLAGLMSACGDDTNEAATQLPTIQKDEALAAKLPQSVRDSGVLRVATDATSPPMQFFGPDGKTLIGFEVDMGNTLGQLLGVKVEWTNLAAASIVSGLQSNRFDVALTSAQDLPGRRETMTFVDYFTIGSNILTEAGNPNNFTDFQSLCGHRLGVQAGTAQLFGAEERQKQCPPGQPIELETFPGNDAAALALRSGRVDAVFNQDNTNTYLLSQASNQYEVLDEVYDRTLVGAVLIKDNPLIEPMADAMRVLVGTDAYDAIVDKWNLRGNVRDEVTINGEL